MHIIGRSLAVAPVAVKGLCCHFEAVQWGSELIWEDRFEGEHLCCSTPLALNLLEDNSPCAYNGLFGLRPSNGRIPYYRMLNSCEGQEIIPSVVGPMTHSAKSLELITKTVVDSQPWLKDPQCLPIPWREEEANGIKNGRKLRIGIMHWDNVILPQPPIRKALKDVEEKLKAAGHEIVEWKIDHVRALDMAVWIPLAWPYLLID